ncbi:DUF302 domain-containing protein [Jannaschia ovalis]|uniref:DUF302 domain-containing protein n=1 Tax=Jannaschia ovalis TaxID=3038773 RepID=A0ABY8L9B5_9RHOB|nr:DUF302 domain-containing protein [Jannaschia sp. GRR-S6-38]WGH77948.1 DUF302 domain-containing protein [Jannaschia sp. GRR-S6-38]
MFRAACLALTLAAAPAAARSIEDDYNSMLSPRPVAETMDRLEAAVRDAGATVFARVDHSGGAASVEMELPEAQLLIFGNPRLGTPVMQQDLRAGLHLPLRVLVHASDGGSVIVWEDLDAMLGGLEITPELEARGRIAGALERFATEAAARE